MQFSIQRPLFDRCISSIGGLIAPNHNNAKYLGMQTKNGELELSVNRDEIVGKVTLSEKAVGDKGLFSITTDGNVLVDGQSNVRAVTKDTSIDVISVKFNKSDANPKEGTLEYLYPNEEKIGLQSVEEKADIKIDPKTVNAVFLGREISKYALFVSHYSGAAGGHPAHANTLFSAKSGLVTFACTDGKQFGIANFKPEKAVTDEFSVVIPCHLLNSVCKLLEPEEDVSVEVNDDYVIFSQDIVFATTKVGRVNLKVVTSKETFVKYEKTFNHLDFKTVIKAKTAMMRRAFERLSVIKSKGCKMKVDVGRNLISFDKQESSGYANNIKVDLVEAKGADIEINVSYEEWLISIAQSTSDDFSVNFSSSSGIGNIQLDDVRVVYFTPYKG